MASVHDVAKYILKKSGKMSTMKLQKLVYYSQAWSLVWDSCPLFKEKIRAWANGPVVEELYERHRGRYEISAWQEGSTRNLSPVEKETIDAVLGYYGDKSAHWLSQLTHKEAPWKEAREGLSDGERGNAEITTASMAEYYESLS